jgi:hypothetical protein
LKILLPILIFISNTLAFSNYAFAQQPLHSTKEKLLQKSPVNINDPLNVKLTDSIFTFQKKLVYPVTSFTVNNLGELYIINLNNQLKKIDDKGDSVGVFNQVTKHGKLSYVDAQNPWKTILFYQNFSTMVLLDKYLNVLTNINLRKQNIFGVKTVASAYDNNFWLYDEQDNKLKKIDDAGKVLMETVDFRLLFDAVPSPVKIEDKDGFVYLYDPKKGFYIFDYYGAFKNKLTFLNWKNIAVIGKSIYGFDENYFYRYNLGSLDLQQYALPVFLKNYTALHFTANKVYVLKDGFIEVYSIK